MVQYWTIWQCNQKPNVMNGLNSAGYCLASGQIIFCSTRTPVARSNTSTCHPVATVQSAEFESAELLRYRATVSIFFCYWRVGEWNGFVEGPQSSWNRNVFELDTFFTVVIFKDQSSLRQITMLKTVSFLTRLIFLISLTRTYSHTSCLESIKLSHPIWTKCDWH